MGTPLDAKQYIKRLEYAARCQMEKINELRAEVAQLVAWINGNRDELCQQSGHTPAIRALVKIMENDDLPTRIRLEATEGLLGYEAPAEIVEMAKGFLTLIFEDEEIAVAERLNATAIARKFESRRVTAPTVQVRVAQTADRTEAWREHEILMRQAQLVTKGVWPLPAGWDDDLRSPDWSPPPSGWPPSHNLAELAVVGRARADAEAKALRLVVNNPGPTKPAA